MYFRNKEVGRKGPGYYYGAVSVDGIHIFDEPRKVPPPPESPRPGTPSPSGWLFLADLKSAPVNHRKSLGNHFKSTAVERTQHTEMPHVQSKYGSGTVTLGEYHQ